MIWVGLKLRLIFQSIIFLKWSSQCLQHRFQAGESHTLYQANGYNKILRPQHPSVFCDLLTKCKKAQIAWSKVHLPFQTETPIPKQYWDLWTAGNSSHLFAAVVRAQDNNTQSNLHLLLVYMVMVILPEELYRTINIHASFFFKVIERSRNIHLHLNKQH